MKGCFITEEKLKDLLDKVVTKCIEVHPGKGIEAHPFKAYYPEELPETIELPTPDEIKTAGQNWAQENPDDTMATNSALNRGFQAGARYFKLQVLSLEMHADVRLKRNSNE